MSTELVEAQTHLIGIQLEKPFPLGFGTLSHLPRVLYQLRARHGHKLLDGIGEASIDFPFSHYDAYDIYHALKGINIEGIDIENRDHILRHGNVRQSLLPETPAAFAAFTMAVDDLTGKMTGKNITALYGTSRNSGKALASISFQENTSLLINEINNAWNKKYIPKPKVGRTIEDDVRTIFAIESYADKAGIQYVLDFNAQYTLEQAMTIITMLKEKKCLLNHVLFIEQPTLESEGISALETFKLFLEKTAVREIPVVADESFVTMTDAVVCTEHGIDLNFKIHKVGGLFHAKEIEESLLHNTNQKWQSLVGGTFPTAIGRTYDQQSVCVLKNATLPGDGMEPSTDWFTNERHIIHESFSPPDLQGLFSPQKSHGLGITPDWGKINMLIIDNPEEEYRKIRHGNSGGKINIQLKKGETYGNVYTSKTGKNPDWNLNI